MNGIKRFVTVLFTVVFVISMLPITSTDVSAAKNVRLNKKKIILTVGKKKTLKVKNKAKGVRVKWSSKNMKVAKVSKKGVVKARRAGKTTIIAKVGKKKFKCKVIVKKKKSPTSNQADQKPTTQATVKPNDKPETSPTVKPGEMPTTEPLETPTLPNDYTCDIENDSEYNHTPKKGELIVLELNIEITPIAEINSVIIGSQKYYVEQIEESRYRVTVPAPESAGSQEIIITGIVLDNGRQIPTDYRVKVDVLKETPVLGDEIETGLSDSKITVAFVIQDMDSTLKTMTAYLTDDEGNPIAEKEIESGKNTVEFDIGEAGDYKVKVEYQYDLGVGGIVTETKQYNQIIRVPIKATIADCTITDANGEEVYYVNKGQKLTATYTIQANTKEKISYITVNSIKIPTTAGKMDNVYTVSFPAPTEAGKKEIKVSSVEFVQSGDVEVTDVTKIEVLKSVIPTIDDVSIVSVLDSTIFAFVVSDKEETFVNGRVTITKENGETVQEITFGKISNTAFKLDMSKIEENVKYNVQIDITYDFDEDKTDALNRHTTVYTDSFKVS